MADALDSKARGAGFTVGGVRMARPFRIRRLGHFGINVMAPDQSLDFYSRLLGFRISDPHDMGARLPPEVRGKVGPTQGYFLRHGTDHHSFVIFPRRAIDARRGPNPEHPEVTTNQITWQVGSLREVTDGFDYFGQSGIKIYRAGRDTPGSNWHVYPYDPDGHVNELYYGIEQVGWDGRSKPRAMHRTHYAEPPALPHVSEYAEVNDGVAAGVDPLAGYRDQEAAAERFDVGGVLLARPFKIVRVGPVRLFVDDVAQSFAFYRDTLGLTQTEEVTWNGHRCVFLRANTEHHSLALYPKALRAELGLASFTSLFSFGLQLGDYRQLKDAVDFLTGAGVTIKYLPPELFPGIDYSAFAIDPDGYVMQLYYYMEQVGWDGRPRPTSERPKVDNGHWPDSVPEASDSFLGEPYLGPWG
jgi:catechol 2,3-dioxygenase-like lactoylglutathione lyase family enzyme